MRRYFKRNSSGQIKWYDRRVDGPLRYAEHSYKHNGHRLVRWSEDEPSESVPSCLSVYAAVYSHHSAVFWRYTEERRMTRKQEEAAWLIYMEGLTARSAAEDLCVSHQAVCDRMNGLKNRAPIIYEWWRNATAGYRGRGGRKRRGQNE